MFINILKPKFINLWLLVLYISLKQSNGQQFFNGLVIDNNSKPIPYALIFYPNTEIGSMSDEKGNFKLKYISDTSYFKISIIGYAELTTSLKKNNFNNQYILDRSIVSLNEVIIKPTNKLKIKKYFYGEIDEKRSYSVCDTMLPYNFELGLKFNTNKSILLNGVTAKISNESQTVTPFRFNLYTIDTLQNIIQKNSWICDSYKLNNWASIYFDNKICIQPGSYILTIEWLTSEFNAKNLYKIKLKDKLFECYGQSINMAYYKNNIGIIKRNNKISNYNKKYKNGYLGPAIDLLIVE